MPSSQPLPPRRSAKIVPPPPAPSRPTVEDGAEAPPEPSPAIPCSVSGSWLTHRGQVRRQNEDACLAGTVVSGEIEGAPAAIDIATNPWIVAVSDGIGGHLAGAEASHAVVTALAACERVTPNGISEILRRLNRQLCERGKKERDFAAMGATIAGLACGGSGLFAFNVGDSRVYRQDADGLVQITRDDSEAEDLIDQGLLQRSEGKRPGFLHALTQAIGGREEAEEILVHILPLAVSVRTRFIICSDGLTDMLHEPQIREILATQPPADAAVAALFAGAMDAGGRDNITIAVVDVEPL